MADVMLVKDNLIEYVGWKKNITIPQIYEQISLEGRTILPGLGESHGHLLGIGRQQQILQLSVSKSEEEVAQLLKKWREKNPHVKIILGRGWNQNKWQKKSFPNSNLISTICPDIPVILTRIDGHALWCNEMAMKLANVTALTKSPTGGEILHFSSGKPSGIFIDSAMPLIEKIIPPRKIEDETMALKMALKECSKQGITLFHDAGLDKEDIELLAKIHETEALPLRLHGMVNGLKEEQVKDFFEGRYQDLFNQQNENQIHLRSLKLFADGALGSCGAHLEEDYAHRKNHRGLELLKPEQITHYATLALEKNIQVCTHAIGDQATLNTALAYEAAFKKQSITSPQRHRFRIEHAQMINPENLSLLSHYGIIASVQSNHFTSDMNFLPQFLGEKRSQSRVSLWQSMQKAGILLAQGTDAPIENLSPWENLVSATTRHSIIPQKESLTTFEAIKSYTVNSSFSSFFEHQTGRLKKNYSADFIILSEDPFSLATPQLLKEIKVEETYFQGKKISFDNEKFLR